MANNKEVEWRRMRRLNGEGSESLFIRPFSILLSIVESNVLSLVIGNYYITLLKLKTILKLVSAKSLNYLDIVLLYLSLKIPIEKFPSVLIILYSTPISAIILSEPYLLLEVILRFNLS